MYQEAEGRTSTHPLSLSYFRVRESCDSQISEYRRTPRESADGVDSWALASTDLAVASRIALENITLMQRYPSEWRILHRNS